MGKHFPVRQKSGNFKKTGKVKENHTGEFQKNVIFYNLVIFKMDQVFSLKKNTGKMRKNTGKVRNFISPEKWEPWPVSLDH